MLILTFGKIGALPIKRTQGFFSDPNHPRKVPKYGCVVMSVLDWIDGINNPSWKRETKQTVGPQTPPYTLRATYEFSAASKGK
jgi:aldose 1-epimerase